MNRLANHPFKQAVRVMLRQYFDDVIVSRFDLIFEAEKIAKLESKHIYNQVKDDNLILEVYYIENGISVYICDIFSWMDAKQTNFKLLRYITDKHKSGAIGKDWSEGKGGISAEVTSGKHITPLQADEVKEVKLN